MKVLIISDTIDADCWDVWELVRYAVITSDISIYVRRGPHDDLPKNPADFDRVIISGSYTSAMEQAPWIDHHDDFLRSFIDLGRPVMGICYGHQSIARALGGRSILRKSETYEVGWTKIDVLTQSKLLKGLPNSFYSFSSHLDEVFQLPHEAIHIARSERCNIQGFELKDKPVFGIQFHPERTLEEGKKSFASHRKADKNRLLLNEKEGKKLYNPAVAETIFKNFLSL